MTNRQAVIASNIGDQVASVCRAAFSAAVLADATAAQQLQTRQASHVKRSRGWVHALAAEFERTFPDDDIAVFCKTTDQHRSEFGLNELMYDIAVCRLAKVRAPHATKELSYVAQALWQVESEMARNGRSALVDFSKLVMGSADFKLFVGPFVGEAQQEGYLNCLIPAATACHGDVFLCQISHPDEWHSIRERAPIIYRFNRNWDQLA